MSHATRGRLVLACLVIGALLVAAGVMLHRSRVGSGSSGVVAPGTTRSDSQPSTRPSLSTTKTSARPSDVVASYMDLVKKSYPALPATQPLAAPLELNQAARLVLTDPIYLSPARGDLWITRGDAPALASVLKTAVDPDADAQTHLLRERVVFVHWIQKDSGAWTPYLVCAAGPDTYKLCTAEASAPFPVRRDFDWARAFSWDDRVVVPSRTGVSVFQFRPRLLESYHEFSGSPATAAATSPSKINQPQALPDGRGLLAWVPWERGRPGSHGAARYVDDAWSVLGPEQDWPEKIVQLVPLRDGSVFQFVAGEDGSATVESAALERQQVDAALIEKLVGELADVDPDVRKKAYTDLSNYGPGAWPAMIKLAEDQPPQAKLLLKQLLKDQRRPTLSGMALLGDRKLQLVDRLSDGGVVFFAAQGVSIPEADGDLSTTAPAWLGVRPGHYIEALPPALVTDLKPETGGLDVVGDQWVVNSDSRGPRLFFGNGFATLLRKDERTFSRILGSDSRGRWLFAHPADTVVAASAASAQTLVLDPHLPDPTPRLPVWQLAIAESVGWDKDNWPVVKNGGAYALNDSEWRPLGADEKFFTRPGEGPAAPTTQSVTAPTTQNAEDSSEPSPLLVGSDGTRYFDGLTELRAVQRDGKSFSWPLPPAANGTGQPRMVQTKDGRLFLFNSPGRVLRIARTPDGAEPFKLEATFTHNIPSTGNPVRVWVDPADRIVVDVDNRLALLFAAGYIPRAISEKMLDAGALDNELP